MDCVAVMMLHRWIACLLMISAAVLSSAVFVYSTGSTLLPADNGEFLVHSFQKISMTRVLIWCLAMIGFSWIGYSSWSVLRGASPLLLVFEADSRSYVLLMWLCLDMFRFSPVIPQSIVPHTWHGLLLHRGIVAVTILLLLVHAKRKQRQAIVAGVPTPRPGVRTTTWATVILVPLAWLPASGLEQTLQPKSAELSKRSYQAGFHGFREWVRQADWTMEINRDQPLALPAGRFRMKEKGGVHGPVEIAAPVWGQPVEGQLEDFEFELPLPVANAIFHWDGALPETLFFTGRVTRIAVIPEAVRRVFPPDPDPRFHELKLPVPFPLYLYRLDDRSFDLEPDGLWVQGDSEARFLLVSPQNLDFLQIGLSAATSVKASLFQGEMNENLSLAVGERRIWNGSLTSLDPGSIPQIYCFSVKVEGGIRPLDLNKTSRDGRYLGVFLQFNLPDTDPDFYRFAAGFGDATRGLSLLDRMDRDQLTAPWKNWIRYRWGRTESQTDLLDAMMEDRRGTLNPLRLEMQKWAPEGVVEQILRRINAGLILEDCGFLEMATHTGKNEYTDTGDTKGLELGGRVKYEMGHVTWFPEMRELLVVSSWQSVIPMKKQYRMFLHVVRTKEPIWLGYIRKIKDRLTKSVSRITADHYPLGGDLMTNQWPEGVGVRDVFRIAVPEKLPDGLYEVRAGWYDPVTGDRLRSQPGDGYVVIGEFQIDEPK